MSDHKPAPMYLAPGLEKIAFDLGWDHAAYQGLILPSDAPQAMVDGFNAGLARLSRREHTRFVKKWLLLRTNALRRGREFSADVTPAYIEAIDVPICPVTFERLTYGDLALSDWSVDRVNNNGSYSMGNLAILSARANQAKNSMSVPDMVDAYRLALVSNEGTYRGLTAIQWARIIALAAEPYAIEVNSNCRTPQCTFVPTGLAVSSFQIAQYRICCGVIRRTSNGELSGFRKIGTAADQKCLAKLLKKVEKRMPVTRVRQWEKLPSPFDIWLDSGIFEAFCDWYDSVGDANVERVLAQDKSGRRFANFTDEQLDSWALDTDGYVPCVASGDRCPTARRSRAMALIVPGMG